jgi:hypothetical protein
MQHYMAMVGILLFQAEHGLKQASKLPHDQDLEESNT